MLRGFTAREGSRMGDERVAGRVIDGHSHLGEMAAWKFYDLKEAVKPTVYEFATPKDYVRHLDTFGAERGLVLPNYGIPRQEQPFLLNPLVIEAAQDNDRIHGGLWVSFLPQNAEMTREALSHAGESGIVALKTTFLLGGNPNPDASDEPWSEFWGEYWKINGAPVGRELKERIFYQNFEELYGANR